MTFGNRDNGNQISNEHKPRRNVENVQKPQIYLFFFLLIHTPLS